MHNLVGRTDLSALAGITTLCRTLVTNDSGAMHLAAAAGLGVTAVFGPTDDRATRPLGDQHTVLTHPVWCRPCMLRECPLDHRCLRGVGVSAVAGVGRGGRHETGRLPRSRRHDHRGRRLPRCFEPDRALSVDGGCDSHAEPCRRGCRCRHQPVGRGARHVHRGVRRRDARADRRAARGRAARASTPTTIVRTIPMGTLRTTRGGAIAASPAAP